MLNADHSTTETDDMVNWLPGGVAVIRLIWVCEVVVHGHNGVFRVRVFHNANTKYAAEVLPSLLGEETAGTGLKMRATGNLGALQVGHNESSWFPALFFFFFSVLFIFCPSVILRPLTQQTSSL